MDQYGNPIRTGFGAPMPGYGIGYGQQGMPGAMPGTPGYGFSGQRFMGRSKSKVGGRRKSRRGRKGRKGKRRTMRR